MLDLTIPVVVIASIILATLYFSKVLYTGRAKPLDPKEWKEFPLEKKILVSPNTAMSVFYSSFSQGFSIHLISSYRFKLPHPQDVLGLPTGQHISVSAEINGKSITRSYTPISNDDDRGQFSLIIKVFPFSFQHFFSYVIY